MEQNRRKKHRVLTFITVFSLLAVMATVLYAVLPTAEESRLYDGFIRLHVIANSDSEADQALKLKVRDAILCDVSDLLADCHDFAQADQILAATTDRLVSTASAAVKAEGASDRVTVLLGDEYYPTRGYDGMRLPAGVYRSLRICIGEAAGHNWWCVLFPPLCIQSAEPQTQLVEAGFTEGQVRILTENENPRYVLKFRFLEWFAEWKNRVGG